MTLLYSLIPAALTVTILFALYGMGRTPSAKDYQAYEKRAGNCSRHAFHNLNGNFTLMNKEKSESSPRKKPSGTIPVHTSDHIPSGLPGKLHVMWLGHSSLLVQMGTKNILIDPVLSRTCSPVPFFGVRRFSEIPILPENLPEIDFLLLSHSHYDHLDLPTLRKCRDRVKHFIVPLGMEKTLIGWGIERSRIHTMAWNEILYCEGITFTCTPSQHFSNRNPFRSNAALWCGFAFRDKEHSVYYTGDGGYGDHFKEIAERIGPIDLMLGECGQYDLAWRSSHMFPEETVQAAMDLHAQWLLPVHWGAFCICRNAWDDSVRRAFAEAEKCGVRIASPIIGEMCDYSLLDQYTGHWWESVK